MSTIAQFVVAQVAIAGCWVVLIGMLTGTGLWFRRAFVRAPLADSDVFFAMWTGYAATLAVLQLWHFARPIDAWTLALMLAVGFSGLVRERSALRAWIARSPVTIQSWHTLVAVLLLLWMANVAVGPISNFDGGAYHIPTMEWTNAYPVVPGLGNLHGRLAFNSSSLLFAALVDIGPLDGRAFHVVGGVLLVPLALHALGAFRRLTRPAPLHPIPVAGDAYAASLIILVVFATVARETSSLDTDLPVALVFLACGERMLRQLAHPATVEEGSRWHWASLVLLTAAATVMKLSAAVLGLAMLLLSAWLFRDTIRTSGARAMSSLIAPTVLVGAWLVRGVVLSGYPMYPASILHLPVSWRVPSEQAAAEAAWVSFSARVLNQHDIPANGNWIGEWVKGLAAGPQDAVMLALPLLLLLSAGVVAVARRQRAARIAGGWLLFLPTMLGLAFWFAVAPHPRFALGALWTMAATAIALVFATGPGVEDARRSATSRRLAIGSGAVIGLLLLVQAVTSPFGFERVGWTARATALGGLATRPGPDHGMHPMGSSRLLVYTTNSGLKVTVPLLNNLCWKSAIICTPHPSPYLRLRVAGQPQHGFEADSGRWEPVRWPDPVTPFFPYWRCLEAAKRSGVERESACADSARQVPTDTLKAVILAQGGDTVGIAPTPVGRRRGRVRQP